MAETTFVRRRAPYLIRSRETWDLIRSQYLRGESAANLAEKFGVTQDNIRRHAGREGWTRRQHAIDADTALRAAGLTIEGSGPSPGPPQPASNLWTSPAAPPEPEPLDPLYEAEEVAALALGAVARCLQQGKYADAERMGRLAEGMTRLARPPAAPTEPPASAYDPPDAVPDPRTPEQLRAEIRGRLDLVAGRMLARRERRQREGGLTGADGP